MLQNFLNREEAGRPATDTQMQADIEHRAFRRTCYFADIPCFWGHIREIQRRDLSSPDCAHHHRRVIKTRSTACDWNSYAAPWLSGRVTITTERRDALSAGFLPFPSSPPLLPVSRSLTFGSMMLLRHAGSRLMRAAIPGRPDRDAENQMPQRTNERYKTAADCRE